MANIVFKKFKEPTREEKVRKDKAYNRRYKKAAVNGLTYWQIRDTLEELISECDEVVYWMDSDEETLVDALDGDYEDANKFKTDFAFLSADVERMYNDLCEFEEPDNFDDIMASSGIGREPEMFLMGYDVYECDYFGLRPFEYEWAEEESMKRLERLTKKELIDQMAKTMSVVFAYIGLQSRYGDLKAAMDILRAQNKEYLDSVKRINEIYETVDFKRYYKYGKEIDLFDSFVEKLPQEAFL